MTTKTMDALLFIDTNILLDFYRERKSDVSIKFLEQMEAFKDRLILGSQVEMEYKKTGRSSYLKVSGSSEPQTGGNLLRLRLSQKLKPQK